MDPRRIYRKTSLGDEALRDRAQLKSGRLRAVLIIVDGHASVGELHLKLGRKQRPEDRIAQLERLGFIEPVPQTRRSKSSRRAVTPPADAVGGIVPERDALPDALPEGNGPAPVVEGSPAPVPEPEDGAISQHLPAEPASESVAETPAAPMDTDAPPASSQPEVQEAAPPLESQALPPPPEETPEIAAAPTEAPFDTAPPAPPDAAVQSPSSEDPLAAGPLDATPAPAVRRQSLAARLRARLARRPARADPGAGRRTGQWPMLRRGLLPLLAAGGVGLLLAGLFLPQRLRPDIEREATLRLGQPVRVERVGLSWHPRLGLRLEGVSAGENPLARASEVLVSPSFLGADNLLHPRIDLHVSGLTLAGEAIGALCAIAGIDASSARDSRIATVVIDGLTLSLPRATLGGLRGSIDLDPAQGTPRVSLGDEGNRLRAQLMPAPGGCRFAAQGSGWHPPLVPGLTLDALKAAGSFDQRGLRLEHFDARTSDGLVAGNGSLAWEPRAALDLRIELQHLDLARLIAALGAPPAARGELDARLHMSASAALPAQLPAALTVSGPVTVSRGAIERFDLVEAARNPGTDRIHGGALRFEQLSAQLQFERGKAALNSLRLSAGALSADGALAVGRDSALSGSLSARIKGAAGEIHVPLHVAGSLAAPELGASAENSAAAAPVPAEQ